MCGGLVSHIHNYLLLLLLRHHQSSSFSVRRRAGSMRWWKRSEEKPIKLFIAFRFVWFFSITIRTFQLFFFIIQFCPVMLSLFFIGFFLSKWTYQCKLTPGFFSLMTFTLLAIFIDSYRKDFKWKKKSFDLMKKILHIDQLWMMAPAPKSHSRFDVVESTSHLFLRSHLTFLI